MNTAEGLKRIAKVIKWVGVLGFVGFAVAAFRPLPGGFLLYIALGIVWGLLCALIAWIVEGFGTPKSQP
jgi:hypothetical protein